MSIARVGSALPNSMLRCRAGSITSVMPTRGACADTSSVRALFAHVLTSQKNDADNSKNKSNDSAGSVQGAVATWSLVKLRLRDDQVATAPCTEPLLLAAVVSQPQRLRTKNFMRLRRKGRGWRIRACACAHRPDSVQKFTKKGDEPAPPENRN